jgi:hypothetical protein
MTCGSSEPLATVGDRCCPCGTVATRTEREDRPVVPLHLSVALRDLRGRVEACEWRMRCPRWGS